MTYTGDRWIIHPAEGRSVLDVGGYDGRAAADLLAHGAASAIVVDNGEWQRYEWPAPGSRDERIQFVTQNFLTWETPADIVVCFNVIYHLRDPLAGLRHLRKLTRDWLALRTSFVAEDEARADGWLWYPEGMGHPNGTVWARPSVSGLHRSLEQAGFTVGDAPDQGSTVGDYMTVVCT